MPNYLSPGVYVEEVEAGSRPIEGVGTATAAFVGLAEKGPANQPTLVTNWSQFANNFGGFLEGSYLAHSVYGYFLNGGGELRAIRTSGPIGLAFSGLSTEPNRINFQAKMMVKRDEELLLQRARRGGEAI